MEASIIFKALGDDTRLKIVRALSEKEMYQELLSERLGLTAATVSFHMKKLLTAGVVTAHREQYYTVYRLNGEAMSQTLRALALGQAAPPEQLEREEAYRRKVIRTFMPNGWCETMPAQEKKRLIIYDEIYRQFTPGETYAEKEVNERIGRIFADFCTVRRMMIAMGWMSRDRQSMYTALKGAEAEIRPKAES